MLNTESNEIDLNRKNNEVLDEDGFLLEASDWNAGFTDRRAQEIELKLTEQHWQLIELIRHKYIILGALPPMRTVCKKVGVDKQELKKQFGSCLNLWKMAGLPNPGEEAKTYMN